MYKQTKDRYGSYFTERVSWWVVKASLTYDIHIHIVQSESESHLTLRIVNLSKEGFGVWA